MSTKTLTFDLDNCAINFDRKVLVTNLLDEYGGLLEEIAKTVQEFLSSEEEKGKQFEKTYLVRGRQAESEDEVITLVPENKLNQRKELLRDVHSMLYSAETVGGSKSPPTEFVPMKSMAIKLDSLEVKDAPVMSVVPTNGSMTVVSKEEKQQSAKKTGGALGAMFKKQETSAAAKKSPEKSPPKKSEPEKKAEKPGALGAMFKKQEAAASKKSPKKEPEKKSNALGAMFKKQEANAKKSPPDSQGKTDSSKRPGRASKKGLSSFLTKKEDQKTKSPAPKKEEIQKIKEEPAANMSVNLFEESESSDDEEALDALKRQVLTDDEEEEKPSTSNKRRRIIDSDDEDTGPEVKVERKEDEQEEAEVMEVEDDEEPKKAETFLDEDGFIVTKKAKNKKQPTKKPNPTPVKLRTPVKVKKESPKSPTPKKEAQSKTPAAKKKQGNIMSFFTKK